MNLSPIKRRFEKAATHYIAVGDLSKFCKALFSVQASLDRANCKAETDLAQEEIRTLEKELLARYNSAQEERREYLATLLERARLEAEEERRERNIRAREMR